MTVDTSDLLKLAQDFESAPADALPRIIETFEDTSKSMAKDWNDNLGGPVNPASRMEHIGKTVDYDVTAGGRETSFSALGYVTTVEAEIGPNLAKKQGAFAGWWEEGSNGLPALHPGYDALKKNDAEFVDNLATAISDALRDTVGG